MPIYAYRCAQCGYQKDVLQKLSDAPLTVCPDCGAEAFAKQLSAPNFQLKGTGWYVTDFRDNDKRPAAGADSAGQNTAGASEGSGKGADKAADKETAGAGKRDGDASAAPKGGAASQGEAGSGQSGKEGGSRRSKQTPAAAASGSAERSSPNSGGSRPSGGAPAQPPSTSSRQGGASESTA